MGCRGVPTPIRLLLFRSSDRLPPSPSPPHLPPPGVLHEAFPVMRDDDLKKGRATVHGQYIRTLRRNMPPRTPQINVGDVATRRA